MTSTEQALAKACVQAYMHGAHDACREREGVAFRQIRCGGLEDGKGKYKANLGYLGRILARVSKNVIPWKSCLYA